MSDLHTEQVEPIGSGATSERPKHSMRSRIRWFRKTRPLWGGLILMLGGYLIARPLLTNDFAFYASIGTRGVMPVILGVGMMLAAVVAIVIPVQRHFPAIVAAMFAVAALPMANLGGWLIGTLLGIIGSGMVFAWTPYTDEQIAKIQARAERRLAKKAAASAG